MSIRKVTLITFPFGFINRNQTLESGASSSQAWLPTAGQSYTRGPSVWDDQKIQAIVIKSMDSASLDRLLYNEINIYKEILEGTVDAAAL